MPLHRPDTQIPLHCGTPAAFPGGDRQALFQLPVRPAPAFTDRRAHTTGDLLAGYGQARAASPLRPGHDQDCFDPTVAAANLPNVDLQHLFGHRQQGQRPRRRQHQQQQQNQQPPIMQNGDNLCYAVSSFHLLEFVKVNKIVLMIENAKLSSRLMKISTQLLLEVLLYRVWSSVLWTWPGVTATRLCRLLSHRNL